MAESTSRVARLVLEVLGLSCAPTLMRADGLAAFLAVEFQGLASAAPSSQIQGVVDSNSPAFIHAIDS
jgi:hypothetical protein